MKLSIALCGCLLCLCLASVEDVERDFIERLKALNIRSHAVIAEEGAHIGCIKGNVRACDVMVNGKCIKFSEDHSLDGVPQCPDEEPGEDDTLMPPPPPLKCAVSIPGDEESCLRGMELLDAIMGRSHKPLGSMQGITKMGYSYTAEPIHGLDCTDADMSFPDGAHVNAIHCVVRGERLHVVGKDTLLIGSGTLAGKNVARIRSESWF
jgi:hypothetical protein